MFTYCKKRIFGFHSKPLRSLGKSFLRGHVLGLIFPIMIALTTISACIQNKAADPLTKGKGPFTLPHPQPYSNVLESSYYAADSLGKGLRFREFSQDMPILVASFVSIDDLNQSSTLGRMVPEQIASRLAQQGFKIIETKLRQGSIFIQKGKGEFLLSRELLNLSTNQGAQGVLVGTYAVSEHFIFISARIVRTEDSSVITGYDYEIPQNKTTKSML